MKDSIFNIITLLIFAAIAIGMFIQTNITVESTKEKIAGLDYRIKSLDYRPRTDVVADITELGRMFANNHNYSLDYNCVNYSEDFNRIMNHLGYRTKTVTGCQKANGSICHRWVRIELDFEPIYGDFTDYSEEYDER